MAGAFHTSNSLAFNRWLATNKSTMATALTDSLASGCSKRVLRKALGMGLKVMLVVNKIDRPTARPDYVVNKVFDLCIELGEHPAH